MRINKKKLRAIIQEQLGQKQGLTRRQMRYLSNSVEYDEYGVDVVSEYYHVGTIYDDRDRDDAPTPFDDNLWVFNVTPEMAQKAYDGSKHYKKGPVTIPTGWFFEMVSDFGGMNSVDGPFGSRQEATSKALDVYPDVITSDAIENTENTNSSDEFGF
jgi:hypothetical protein